MRLRSAPPPIRASARRLGAGGEAAAPRPAPSLLLVTLDTVRADRIGAYGHAAARTPNLDRLAARGVRFERAYAQVPLTLPSHASLLTGLHPPEHGLHDNGRRALGPGPTTLAELFSARGFRTGAFVSAIALDRSFGLDRGFDHYDDELDVAPGSRREALERSAAHVVDAALAWLTSGEAPFFAWVHFYDPHAPYAPPSAFRESGDLYDGEIAYVDVQLGRLLEWLEAERLVESTLVVVVADHGESLGEKGEKTHGSLIYEGTQRIPLIVSWPGVLEEGVTATELAQQVDLLPTVLELCDWKAPESVSGRSLAPVLRGEKSPAGTVYLESDYCALNFGWSPLRGIVHERWKLIQAPTRELYDLARDPGEEHNLAAEHPETVSALERRLEDVRACWRRGEGDAREIDADLTRALGKLGYTQGFGRGVVGEAGVGINPVERIEVLELYHAAIGYGHLGQTERMIAPLEEVVESCPESAGFRALLGEAYTRRGRRGEGIEQLLIAVELDPDYDPAHYYLARAYQSQGDEGLATAHYQLTVELRPSSLMARLPLARLLVTQGDHLGAIEQYRRIVELEPDELLHWINLGNLLVHQEQWLEAVAAWKRVIELDPEQPGNLNYCAWLLATAPEPSARDGERAVELAERVVDRIGRGDPTSLDTLAAAYAECGRWDEAVEAVSRALELASGRGAEELVEGLNTRRELYLAREPFRAGGR